jgi:uncharacterized membrane protein
MNIFKIGLVLLTGAGFGFGVDKLADTEIIPNDNDGYGHMEDGYYDDYSRAMYNLHGSLVFVSYTVIINSTIILLSYKTVSKDYSMTILDERLSKGEISVEDYQKIKRTINNK